MCFGAFIGGALLGALFAGGECSYSTSVNIDLTGVENRLDNISDKIGVTNNNLANINHACQRIASVLEGDYLSNLRKAYHQDLQIAQLETQFMDMDEKKLYFESIMNNYAYNVAVYSIPRYKDRNVRLFNKYFKILKHNDYVYIQDKANHRGVFHIEKTKANGYRLNKITSELDENGRIKALHTENELSKHYLYYPSGKRHVEMIGNYKHPVVMTKYSETGEIISRYTAGKRNTLHYSGYDNIGISNAKDAIEEYFIDGKLIGRIRYDWDQYLVILEVYNHGKVCYTKTSDLYYYNLKPSPKDEQYFLIDGSEATQIHQINDIKQYINGLNITLDNDFRKCAHYNDPYDIY